MQPFQLQSDELRALLAAIILSAERNATSSASINGAVKAANDLIEAVQRRGM